MPILNEDHRPWPLPKLPWVMKQTWEHLLFAHWEIDASKLQAAIPPQLTLDTYEGQAWIAVVPFGMTAIRLRGLPPIPGTSAFPEINVRTYVTYKGKPGVYFFSLDAANPIAVAVARRFFHLPYYRAEMNVAVSDNGTVFYGSKRTHKNTRTAYFQGSYAPVTQKFRAVQGTLDAWLTERYCLYTVHGDRVYRGDIHHEPWPLQLAEADLYKNTMCTGCPFELPDSTPLFHYAKKLDVLIYPLQLV